MKRKMIKELYSNKNYDGKKITVAGWIKTVRNSKNFGFIELNDGSAFKNCQIVFDTSLSNYDDVTKLTLGSSLIVEGTYVLTPENRQSFEIKATKILLEGDCPSDYPIQKKNSSLEFLREQAYLRPRTNTFNAVFRIRSACAFALHKYFNEQGFIYVNTPIITGSDAEGAGEMFQVTTLDLLNPPKIEGKIDYSKDFFGKQTSLTVSGQLNGEAFAQSFGKIYTFGPTFRAENSNTPRHAAEFWMVEPEIAFADLFDDMDLEEDVIKYVVSYLLENYPDEIEFFNKFIEPTLKNRLTSIIENKFVRISYTDAIEKLKESGQKFEYPVFWGCDLQSEHERYLTEQIFKCPVFVYDYPKEIKAFYMRQNDDGKTVAAVDLLVPGIGELIGGSQREERYDVLLNRINELGMNHENYWWYLNLRKYGSTKHAGFGIGFERLVMYVTGMSNIRDVELFPRTAKNAEYWFKEQPKYWLFFSFFYVKMVFF